MSFADHALSVAAMALAVGLVVMAWWRKAPIVLGLIAANFAVFAFMVLTAGGGLSISGSALVDDLAARVVYLSVDEWPRLYTIFTATFLHADLFHILGNMVVLFLLGSPFEERVGRKRFLAVYFWSAIVAVLLHALYIDMTGTEFDRYVPLVGASGAVFGVLGAFATMFPTDRVTMPLGFLILPRVPVFVGAIVMMGFEMLAISGGGLGRVAHAAHFGGAVGGVILGVLFRSGRVQVLSETARTRKIRYDTLERLAATSQQHGWIAKLRENEDHPDTQRAWLDRLLPTLQCPDHAQPFTVRGRRLECPLGHSEAYAE